MTGVRLTQPATQNPFLNSGVIRGAYGIYGTNVAAWTVSNLGTVSGTQMAGVTLAAGGSVVNGSSAQHSASISGLREGVIIAGGTGTVTNFGTIAVLANARPAAVAVEIDGGTGRIANSGLISGAHTGVRLGAGGNIVNNRLGTISGGFVGAGIYRAAGAVRNDGAILGTQIGLNLNAGGRVTNGSASDTAASIAGAMGILAVTGAASVSNFGTITGSLSGGIDLLLGGSVTNGSASDTAATIASYSVGVRITKIGSVTNFGTIASQDYAGLDLNGGGRVTNGSASDSAAAITSGLREAVVVGGAGTVVNYGLIAGRTAVSFLPIVQQETVLNAGRLLGTFGTAIQFGNGIDRLIEMPGATIAGVVAGGTGSNTLELASGASIGTIAGLGSSFTNFGTIMVDPGARWSLGGSNTLATAATLALSGTLVVEGSLKAGPVLTMSGTGTLAASTHGVIQIGTGGNHVAGHINVDPGSLLIGSGGLGGPVLDAGTIEARGGTLSIAGSVGGSGIVAIGTGATLFDENVLNAAKIRFVAGGTSETLLLGRPTAVSATILGFNAPGSGDRIDLLKFVGGQTAFSANTLTLTGAGGVATLHFAAPLTLAQLHLASDHQHGTMITFV